MPSLLHSGRGRGGGYDSRVSTTQGLRTQPPDDLLGSDAPAVVDSVGRPLHDLRISVTDRCNFRCTYCMPKEVFGREYQFLDRREILSFEEITRVTRIFVDQGVEKVRLTGGEPTLRRGLPKLVAMLSEIEGAKDLTLTTNGSRLAEMARELRD